MNERQASPIFKTWSEALAWQTEQEWRNAQMKEWERQAETQGESPQDLARRLWSDGYSYKQIAQRVNRVERTVRRWLNGK